MINRHLLSSTSAIFSLALFFLSVQAVPAALAEPAKLGIGSCSADDTPVFQADTEWLKLPPEQMIGAISAVAVDDADHLWVLHRPASVEDTAPSKVLPPIVEFDAEGHFIQAFGGSSDQYQWPDREHSLALSADGHVWIGGSSQGEEAGRGDDMLIAFNRDGQFIQQIGRRGASTGNLDRENLHAPGDIYIDDAANELYVADGYGNQRVIVFDATDGSFLRMWNAFGSSEFPESPTELEAMMETTDDRSGPSTFNGVHGVEMANDGKVYVSDRLNQRIQVFTAQGDYLEQTYVNQSYPSPLTASGIAFSSDQEQKYMYVVDWGNQTIEVFDRLSLTHIGQLGGPGSEPGKFLGPHLIDTDSQGVIYVAEVRGARVQRLIPCSQENGQISW